MAINNFFMQVNLGGTPATANAASTVQIVTPWGQTGNCSDWEEAINQAFFRNSRFSGRMGAYFGSANGATTNGLTTTISGTMSANDIASTP